MPYTRSQEIMLRSLPEMERALSRAKAWSVVKGRNATCPNPSHEDKHPSGWITVNAEGIVHFGCKGCGFHGDIFDVIAIVDGTTPANVMAEVRKSDEPANAVGERTFDSIEAMTGAVSGAVEGVYQYTDPHSGQIDLLVIRHRTKDGKKHFLQAHRRPDGLWVPKRPVGAQPLYNRNRVAAATEVLVVEGEKAVHALHEYGIVATTSPGGSQAAQLADWNPLAGKQVVLWPDHDVPGAKYADDVRDILATIKPAPSIRRIDPAELGLEDKGDAYDYIEQIKGVGMDPREPLRAVIQKAKGVSRSSQLLDRLDAIHDGQWNDVPWPWESLTRLGRGLLPQNVCVLCGQSGGSKSFYTMYALLYWLRQGVDFAYLDLEEDRTYNLYRALSMLDENGDLLDEEWVKSHQRECHAAYERHRDTLDALSQHLYEPPPEDVTTQWVCHWVKQQAESGRRLVIVDPITVAAPSAKPWIDDQKFVTEIKRIMRANDASILLITHRKKGATGVSLDDLAGGAAYQRLAQAIFWLESHGREGATVTVHTALGRADYRIQHTIHICKSRKGRGTGSSIAFRADWETMTFSEIGLIVKEKEKGYGNREEH